MTSVDVLGSFAGRHAVVTGSGSGIGRASAIALAARGADVTLIARTSAALEHTAEEVRRHGMRAIVCPADVRDERAVEAAFARASEHRTVDLLVTAAGINRPADLIDTPVSAITEMLETNILGTLLTCRAFGRRLLDAGRPGAAVCLSSQMGSVGSPGRVTYCATKHAVNGVTKALSLEWAPFGIRVNAVAPTFIETAFTAPMLAVPSFREEVLSRIPLGRIGQVADLDGVVCFLLSDAAGLVTGHVMAVDGGWTAQ